MYSSPPGRHPHIVFGLIVFCSRHYRLLAAGVLAHVVFLVVWMLWLAAGDILLKFALEDERFFQVATGSNALSFFEDTEFSLPQPLN